MSKQGFGGAVRGPLQRISGGQASTSMVTPSPVPQRVSDRGGQMQPRGRPSPVQGRAVPQPRVHQPPPQSQGLLAGPVRGRGRRAPQPSPQENSLMGLFSAMGGTPPRRRQPPPQRNPVQRGLAAMNRGGSVGGKGALGIGGGSIGGKGK